MTELFARIPPHSRRISTAAQMREFDRRASEEFGVPSVVLMENAGRHVFDAVLRLLDDPRGKRVVVIAGRGNNGGDGFVVARHMRDAGAEVRVWLLGDPDSVKGDARTNLEILTKTGLGVARIDSIDEVRRSLLRCDAVVDALFGTGLRGDVTGPAAELIAAMNEADAPVVAVDIPSGLDADTGAVLGECVHADVTVTFALPKIGHVTYPGAAFVGELVVGDIGIPHALYDEIDVELSNAESVAGLLPARRPDSNKGTYGTVTTIAGSAGMTGAAVMAAESALRSGAGLSVLGVPASLMAAMAVKLTEVISRALPEVDGAYAPETLESALDLAARGSVVFGCGIGHRDDTCEFAQEFVRRARAPMVVDADALNCLTRDLSVLEGEHGPLVLTPHPGEMSRLMGTTIAEVQSDRIGVARHAASRFHCVVALKGARTVVANPEGRVYINPTGNSGMATGGTGDVLAGVIGSLIAQGLAPLDAAVAGVYIHGLAGEIAAERFGEAGMIAGDLISAVPEAMRRLYASDGR